MHMIELGDRQLTYLLLALRRYEQALMDSEDEALGDELDDLLMVQDLISKLSEYQQSSHKD